MKPEDTAPAPGPALLKPSLRQRLQRHVLLPLALTWLVGTLVMIGVARYFTQQAYDRSLLDDAWLVGSNVREQAGRLTLEMSPREQRTVLFDREETVLLAVRDPAGRLVAGTAGLAAAAPQGEVPYQFSDIVHEGMSLRAVVLRLDTPVAFEVLVAQTTQARTALLRRLLLYSAVPQLLLLVLLAQWLRRAIEGDVRPLAELQQALDSRDAHDLAPVRADVGTRDVERLTAALNALLQRLERSVRAQREFTGNVAHELRTPLAGIRALANYGLAQKDPAVWREQLERIVGSEARASRLTDQLLALALADEARTGIQLKPLRLDEVVNGAMLRFLARADSRGVDLGVDNRVGEVEVIGDVTLLEGLLDNLIDNALRYGCPADGGPAAVTLEVESREDRVFVAVRDNGPGLPAGMAERLMQRWSQGEAGQALGEGSGLGLAIVAQYARLLGSELVLQPAEPQGLQAGVSLRRAGG